MLRISKLTDYGIVILVYMAKDRGSLTSRQISDGSNIPLSTVSKVLKTLTRNDILLSTRGATGGYTIAKTPIEISVDEIVAAMEGPLAITECSTNEPSTCSEEHTCPLKSHWNHINLAVQSALRSVTLQDLLSPIPSYTVKTSATPYANIS
jgi:FeS assembly SUF system regulator